MSVIDFTEEKKFREMSEGNLGNLLWYFTFEKSFLDKEQRTIPKELTKLKENCIKEMKRRNLSTDFWML